jgi:hypothetical protein
VKLPRSSFYWLLITLCFWTSACAPRAVAHETRPAYLEIKETSPNCYDILWRTPVNAGMRLPILLQLPTDAKNLSTPTVQELADSLLERRSIEVEGGLGGKRIDFVGLQGTITDVLVRVEMLGGRTSTTIVHPPQSWFEVDTSQSRWAVAGAFILQGIRHISLGVDHLLFVLALIIITRGGWKLVKTVTAFTLSHSITLTAATLGFVHVPQRPVEAVIALSIVFVAAEIVRMRRGLKSITVSAPWMVAFSFGLIHGLGFAGGLSDAGLPVAHIPTALLFFSLGVETGHFLFIGVVLSVIALVLRVHIPLPRWAELVPPYAIGTIAMFWVIQRLAAF